MQIEQQLKMHKTHIDQSAKEEKSYECVSVCMSSGFPFMRRQRHSSPSPALATLTAEDDGKAKNSNSGKQSNSGTASQL